MMAERVSVDDFIRSVDERAEAALHAAPGEDVEAVKRFWMDKYDRLSDEYEELESRLATLVVGEATEADYERARTLAKQHGWRAEGVDEVVSRLTRVEVIEGAEAAPVAPHEHMYAMCEDCGLFCTTCGELRAWLPTAEAVAAEIVSHWHHAGTLNGPAPAPVAVVLAEPDEVEAAREALLRAVNAPAGDAHAGMTREQLDAFQRTIEGRNKQRERAEVLDELGRAHERAASAEAERDRLRDALQKDAIRFGILRDRMTYRDEHDGVLGDNGMERVSHTLSINEVEDWIAESAALGSKGDEA